jgi:hypothetical protein
VAIGAVAAEEAAIGLASSASSGGADGEARTAQPEAANGNVRKSRAGSEPSERAVEVPAELTSIATSIGQAWSEKYVRDLQSQGRDIVGAWPGTLREARRQVLARVSTKLETDVLEQLARIANLAARRGWETVSEPDLEA